jgi:hypothetical protein
LINRKHRYRPPKDDAIFLQIRSVCPLSGTLIAGEKLVGVDRSGDGEQCQDRDDRQRFHGSSVAVDCGQKRLALAHFEDDPKKHGDRPGSLLPY